jgi:multidrug efflux pump
MSGILDWCMEQWRLVMAALLAGLVLGFIAYNTIPKEADPDVPIPFVVVSVPFPGISPEDGERLIARPMETQLRTIEGLEEVTSVSEQGYVGLYLEFDVNFDKEIALQKVREQVDLAKAEIPATAEEPIIREFNVSTFPILVVSISGQAPERTLLKMARELQDDIETVSSVLEAPIIGDREELLEIVIDQARVESFGLSAGEVFAAVDQNNRLVAAGDATGQGGSFAVKVPGLIETPEDVLNLPVRATETGVVRLRDVADVRPTFVDAQSFARFNGQPAVVIEVKKRVGENIVETIADVKRKIAARTADWPDHISVDYSLDQSFFITDMLDSLESSILLAIMLVLIVVVAALGVRSGLLVGFSIPASFLLAFLLLDWTGYTINFMVLFGMILAVGMLVDGAIIVVEFADRKMAEGFSPREAYPQAAKRMFWPVVSSTLTTLAAFLPMLLWPGVSGKFMSYLPITLILVLTASTLVALVFLPVVGRFVGRAQPGSAETLRALAASERGDIREIGGVTGWYATTVSALIQRPRRVVAAAVAMLFGVIILFNLFGKGVEFFVDIEPNRAFVNVFARGNLSPAQKLDLVREVEARVLASDGLKSVFTSVGGGGGGGFGQGGGASEDKIGAVSIEFIDFDKRRPANEILEDIRTAASGLPGIRIEIEKEQGGPPTGKDVIVEITGHNAAGLLATTGAVRRQMETMSGLIEIEDSRPLPGIEYQLIIDREQAGRFGADVGTLGAVVQLVTNGLKVGDYRPDESDDEVEIRVRYPLDDRGIMALDTLRVQTAQGLVPISNFVKRVAAQQVSFVERVDGERILRVRANVAVGVLADDKVQELRSWIETQELPRGVSVRFGGADEQQAESGTFLVLALFGALFLMGAILLIQFNSFYAVFLVLSTVVMSTIGVMLGMLVMGQTFSIIMTGTGIVALAGIVVNNNIVLIDTYQHLIRQGFEPLEAIVRTGAQRLRPVFLTTVTTMVGLLPMMFNISVDFFEPSMGIGGPVTDWWVSLSTAVVFGMGFSTILTLIVTPCLLAIPHQRRARKAARLAARARPPAASGPSPAPAE